MTLGVALVTGASRGVGSRIAAGLIADGYHVIGAARTPVEEWNEVSHDRFHPISCDLTDESGVKRLFSSIRKQHGRLDLVVNNAGVFNSDLLTTASAGRFLELLHVNLVSAQLVTREAAKLMRPKSFGRVVSISSIATRIPLTGNALYSASKVALEHLMVGFANEFKGSGLTFNSIAISFIEDTGMVKALRSDARSQYESRLLVPNALSMEQLMHAIRFLVSRDAGPITAQTIVLGSPT